MTDLVCDFRHFSTSFVPDKYNCLFFLSYLIDVFICQNPLATLGLIVYILYDK